MSIDGILNLIKPRGGTSFKVAHLVRRWSGGQRVGYIGTLDPMAAGVLPVCLGQGTRVAEFMSDYTKTYRAEIELGAVTDTYDATGRVTERHDISSVTLAQIENALESLRGDIEQKPPMYSAVKYGGRRLYQFAAAGLEIEREARKVRILHLDLIDWHPPTITIEVECSKGTYIRALAYDLGQAIGCGAHLADLIRLRCGPFHIEDGITLPQIEDAFRGDYWQRFLYSTDTILLNWQAAVVGEETRHLIENGRLLTLKDIGSTNITTKDRQPSVGTPRDSDWCRAYTLDGRLVGLLCWEAEIKRWYPDKVFSRTQNQ